MTTNPGTVKNTKRQPKTREAELRRLAKKRDLLLIKSTRSDLTPADGAFWLAKSLRGGGGRILVTSATGLTLDEIEAVLLARHMPSNDPKGDGS